VANVNGTNGSAPPRPASPDFDAVANGDITYLERAAVRRLHARDITIERSAVGVLRAERATLAASTAAVVMGTSIACDEVRVGILAAPVVRGDVHTLIDLRTAFALGLGMALGRALLSGGRGLAGRLRS
jgi:hypothetical protein